jgi:RNA polymerase sigma factor (sigma-70 family)
MTDAYLPRIAAGDRTAMRECIDRYGKLVWSLALRLSPSRSDAEDAVQEIFTNLWQNASRYDPTRSSEPTFVAVLARRRLIDRLRMQGRRGGLDAPEFDPDRLPAVADDVDARLSHNAEARAAADALGALPADRRRVIALSVVEGLTQEEIAQRTQMPLGTVKSHLRRGLLAVRAALTGGAGPALAAAERSSS